MSAAGRSSRKRERGSKNGSESGSAGAAELGSGNASESGSESDGGSVGGSERGSPARTVVSECVFDRVLRLAESARVSWLTVPSLCISDGELDPNDVAQWGGFLSACNMFTAHEIAGLTTRITDSYFERIRHERSAYDHAYLARCAAALSSHPRSARRRAEGAGAVDESSAGARRRSESAVDESSVGLPPPVQAGLKGPPRGTFESISGDRDPVSDQLLVNTLTIWCRYVKRYPMTRSSQICAMKLLFHRGLLSALSSCSAGAQVQNLRHQTPRTWDNPLQTLENLKTSLLDSGDIASVLTEVLNQTYPRRWGNDLLLYSDVMVTTDHMLRVIQSKLNGRRIRYAFGRLALQARAPLLADVLLRRVFLQLQRPDHTWSEPKFARPVYKSCVCHARGPSPTAASAQLLAPQASRTTGRDDCEVLRWMRAHRSVVSRFLLASVTDEDGDALFAGVLPQYTPYLGTVVRTSMCRRTSAWFPCISTDWRVLAWFRCGRARSVAAQTERAIGDKIAARHAYKPERLMDTLIRAFAEIRIREDRVPNELCVIVCLYMLTHFPALDAPTILPD